MADWRPVGRVVRLQVQKDLLVRERYDPSGIMSVDRLSLTASGALAPANGGWVVDSHHRDFPGRRHWNADRALSVGFTSHYEAMKARFGAAPYGCAGENVTVDADHLISKDELAGGLAIEGDGRRLELAGLKIAQPCVPFTEFLMARPDAPTGLVAEQRDFLRDGMRGFVAGLGHLDEPTEIQLGDEVLLRA